MTVDELESRLLARGLHVTLDQCVRPAVAAQVLGVTEGTLRNWRSNKAGPAFFKRVQITYRLLDLIAWSEQRGHYLTR
jgi:hypothetical protein